MWRWGGRLTWSWETWEQRECEQRIWDWEWRRATRVGVNLQELNLSVYFSFLCFVVHLQHQLPMFRASPRVPNALSQFMIFGLRKQPLLFLSKQPLMFFVFGTLNEFKWKNDLL
ncbi:hypothetical protein BDA96_06G010000 [Sorghum bicolor]|uniref:Uncharacterized protein n=1 Tax=Sorghum bicolor TaxID=4558 RepID=A0A921QMS9_SORBI|nr:hypothetical protein BDA96_06G010000 [Sorghum bicolor]